MKTVRAKTVDKENPPVSTFYLSFEKEFREILKLNLARAKAHRDENRSSKQPQNDYSVEAVTMEVVLWQTEVAIGAWGHFTRIVIGDLKDYDSKEREVADSTIEKIREVKSVWQQGQGNPTDSIMLKIEKMVSSVNSMLRLIHLIDTENGSWGIKQNADEVMSKLEFIRDFIESDFVELMLNISGEKWEKLAHPPVHP